MLRRRRKRGELLKWAVHGGSRLARGPTIHLHSGLGPVGSWTPWNSPGKQGNTPDPCSTSFVRIDATGEHPVTLDDHHGKIAAVQISDAVPEDIRGEFDTVRNLHLYSWYVYEFTVPAVLYAYTLVEKAIKERCARSAIPLKDHRGLRKLLQLAIDQRWLTNADFQHALELKREEMTFSADDGHPPTFHSTPLYDPADTDYCERLADSLPKLRNFSAHGEAGLGFPSSALGLIKTCACIINAVFSGKQLTLAASRQRQIEQWPGNSGGASSGPITRIPPPSGTLG